MTEGQHGSGARNAPTFRCPYCEKQHRIFMLRCPDYGEQIDDVYKMEGRVLEGKYKVGRLIAEGGMGLVYEGEHLALGQKLAIKFLMRKMVKSAQLLARFQNEARMAASLGHRNIVEIIDMGSTPEKIPFIVMEYLEGMDLSEVLEHRTRLPAPLAVEFALQVLGALRAVHERGIIHRDLKPENVYIVEEADGTYTIKIVDFGVSRLDRPTSRKRMKLTQTGSVFGTPRYMAPEQARGDREIDHRVDLYACGVLLYEMLTGAVPFDREEYNALIIAITTEDPVHVCSHGVPIPAGLDEVVMKALVKEPDDRYANVEEFMQALVPYRSDQPTFMDASTPLSDLSGSLPGHAGVPASSEQPALEAGTPSSAHDPATVKPGSGLSPAPGSPVPRSRETDRTAPGLEVPPASRERPRKRTALWVILAACLVVVVAGGAAGSVLLMRERARTASQQQEREGERPADPPAEARPAAHELDLAGLPEGAEVYVDGLMHPERPIVVEESDGPTSLRITAPGHEDWEQSLTIEADVSMTVEMTAVPAPSVEEPAGEAKPSASKKKKKKKKTPPAQGGKKSIDRSFPGLK